MSKYSDWDYEDEYRDFKRPKKIQKDKFGKHKNAIYDLIEDELNDDYSEHNQYDDFVEE
jgi:hypothetical protein